MVTLLYSDPKIAGYLFRFRNCVGCASAVELQSHHHHQLQSHRRILAPGRHLVATGMPTAYLHVPRTCLRPITIYRLKYNEFIGKLCGNLMESLYRVYAKRKQ